MSLTGSPSHLVCSLAAAMVSLVSLETAAAESGPDTEKGRYTLSQIADGFLRLDTQTGTVSTCRRDGDGWACYAVPDERKAMDDEIGRLQSENASLKAKLAARDTVTEGDAKALPKPDKPAGPKAEGERKIEIPLPSDSDIDRVMSLLQRAWRRLVEMADRIQKDATGRI